ncbi:MAG: YihY/virulence factor BrkB family protein [Leptolyngbyaceae cyanobacterium RU_5_1]|nr:YihY/virulence factor BrkB family protein [Leptolyngbyaceae cyanobacterium RU_5_1]
MIHYLQTRILPSKPAQLLIKTGLKWDQDNGPGMAAALAYYALFSLFPMLLVILSAIGWLIDPQSGSFRSILATIRRFLPPDVHDLIKTTLVSLNENSVGAGIVGFGLLLFAASAVFRVLRRSVNRIWRSPSRVSEARSILTMVVFFIVNQVLAFLLVFGTALLLLTSLISNIVIKTILELITNFEETFAFIKIDQLQKGLQASSSILILALVWLSALLVAVLLEGLQQLVSNSVIAIGSHFLSYGAIGSVMILMLWIFLTFQIFLFGCVLSYVYAHLFGSRRHSTIIPLNRVPE